MAYPIPPAAERIYLCLVDLGHYDTVLKDFNVCQKVTFIFHSTSVGFIIDFF
jgi:hypothetical protein